MISRHLLYTKTRRYCRYRYCRKKEARKKMNYTIFGTQSNMSCFRKKFILRVQDKENKPLYENHDSAYNGDAGLDLFVAQDTQIPPGETVLVDTGVQARCRSVSKCPWHWVFGKIFKYHSYTMFPRSSIYKTPLMLHNSIGLIDRNYTGNIKMPLRNMSTEPYTVQRGVRLCQLVTYDLSNVSCKLEDFSDETDCGCCKHNEQFRGSNGFGSSGK